MRGDPFRHSHRRRTLRGAAEKRDRTVRSGQPAFFASASLRLTSSAHTAILCPRQAASHAKYDFLPMSHSYSITPLPPLSTNARRAKARVRPRRTHSHAHRFIAYFALFSSHPSRHRKSAGTACPGAWPRCRKPVPSGDISKRGRSERDLPRSRQRQGEFSKMCIRDRPFLTPVVPSGRSKTHRVIKSAKADRLTSQVLRSHLSG